MGKTSDIFFGMMIVGIILVLSSITTPLTISPDQQRENFLVFLGMGLIGMILMLAGLIGRFYFMELDEDDE